MNKYHVYLAENWKRVDPFTTEWDYELLGDKLRAEFDVYFAEQEKLANAGGGKSKQLLKGEYIKKFMILKRIYLVDNPATGNLKSVFILRPDEKKIIDERTRRALGAKFEYKFRIKPDGTKTTPEGFLMFDLIEGSETKPTSEVAAFKVSGNDIEYFKEEIQEEIPSTEVTEVPEGELVCEVCSKKFTSKRALHMHGLVHKKK